MEIVLNGTACLDALFALNMPPIHFLLLGSTDDHFHISPSLKNLVRAYGVDALSPTMNTAGECLKAAVAPRAGRATFFQRNYSYCSSLTIPLAGMVERYALQDHFRVLNEEIVDCVTVHDLARQFGVPYWDFLKTDLEGLDFAVVESLGDDVRRSAVVQMELRTEPFHVGEPYMHEVVAYMHERGFRVFDLTRNRWRMMGDYWKSPTRGHTVCCDVYFVNIALTEPRQRLRQAIVLGSLGHVDYAGHVLTERPFTDPAEHAASREVMCWLFGAVKEDYIPFDVAPHMVDYQP